MGLRTWSQRRRSEKRQPRSTGEPKKQSAPSPVYEFQLQRTPDYIYRWRGVLLRDGAQVGSSIQTDTKMGARHEARVKKRDDIKKRSPRGPVRTYRL